MTRWLTLAAACLCTAGTAQAQNVQLYGLVDMSAGRFQAAGAPAVWRADNGGMTTSFLGFKGSDDLGGGLKAKFAIEHFLRADTGQAGRFNGDAFWARDAYVGLSGAFGTTVLGRNTTPLFVSTLLFNAFGDSYAFSPTIRQVFTPALLPFFGDSGWDNSVSYASADNGDLRYNLTANLGEAARGATGKNFGANLLYFSGPLGLSAAWQRVKNGDGISSGISAAPAGFSKQDTWQLGASYDLSVAKLFAQFTRVRTGATIASHTEMWSLGASVPIGAGKLLAQVGHANARFDLGDASQTIWSVGYDYNLSKRTDAYAVYSSERLTGVRAGNTVAGGVRLRF